MYTGHRVLFTVYCVMSYICPIYTIYGSYIVSCILCHVCVLMSCIILYMYNLLLCDCVLPVFSVNYNEENQVDIEDVEIGREPYKCWK